MIIRSIPSPNYGARRDGATPRFIMLHYTAMASAEAAVSWLCTPEAQVSAHYVICRTGAVTQLVQERDRAWHAGVGSWNGITDMNSWSVGIELDNDGSHPFTDPLMRSLEAMLRAIMLRWGISADRVIAHSDYAPGRKIDPGPQFDWTRLAHQGLASHAGDASQTQGIDTKRFREIARNAGYTADVDDATLLAAVRLRYRPRATGPITSQDIAVLGTGRLWA